MSAPSLTARDQLVRELDRTSKRDLVVMAKAIAKQRGSNWLIGGPDDWSKDQLIKYIAPREEARNA